MIANLSKRGLNQLLSILVRRPRCGKKKEKIEQCEIVLYAQKEVVFGMWIVVVPGTYQETKQSY